MNRPATGEGPERLAAGIAALESARGDERSALLIALAGEWGVLAGSKVLNSTARLQVQVQAERFGLDGAPAVAAFDEGVAWRQRTAIPSRRQRQDLIDALDLSATDTALLRLLAMYTSGVSGLAWPGNSLLAQKMSQAGLSGPP